MRNRSHDKFEFFALDTTLPIMPSKDFTATWKATYSGA